MQVSVRVLHICICILHFMSLLFVYRFQQIESRWGYSGTSDKIRFIVDRRIFVVGFGLYGSIHGPSEYDVTIQVDITDYKTKHKSFCI